MKKEDKINVLSAEIISRENQIKELKKEIEIFQDFIKDVENIIITDDNIEYIGKNNE